MFSVALQADKIDFAADDQVQLFIAGYSLLLTEYFAHIRHLNKYVIPIMKEHKSAVVTEWEQQLTKLDEV